MKDETLKLCYYASELYESKNISANQIYEFLTKTKIRKSEVTKARQLVSFMLYNYFNLTQWQIANELGLKNHSSILYHIDQVYFKLRTDKRMQYRVDFMKDIINGVQRTVKRDVPISRAILSNDDKLFIESNISNGYSVSYFSDILNKTKGAVKHYLATLQKETLNKSRKEQVFLPKFVSTKIDY